MPALQPNKGKTRLLHGVCESARAACYATLLAERPGFYLLLVAEPRRAEARAAEIAQLATWLLPKTPPEICFFPEAPRTIASSTPTAPTTTAITPAPFRLKTRK